MPPEPSKQLETSQLLDELRRIKDQSTGDYERDHVEADEALLSHIGDPEITEAFESIRKEYA